MFYLLPAISFEKVWDFFLSGELVTLNE